MIKKTIPIMMLFLAISGCSLIYEKDTPPEAAKIDEQFTTQEGLLIPPTTITAAARLPSLTIPPPTQTPLATLSLQGNQEIVIELLRDNNGCQYPCFWGIIPGETDWNSAESFLSLFATKFYDLNITNFENNRYLEPEERVHGVNISVPSTYISSGVMPILFVESKSSQVKLIRVIPQNHDLAGFLKEYGEPSQIYVWTFGYSTVQPKSPYVFVLYYGEKGIMVAFFGEFNDFGMTVQHLDICPRWFFSYSMLWLWAPKYEFAFQEVGDLGLTTDEFWSLDKLSDISTSDFYRIYSDPENLDNCFQILDPNFLED